MTNKNKTKKTKEIKMWFSEDTKTFGDEIQALTNFFTGRSCSAFVLEQALKKVISNNLKIAEYKEKLLEVTEND